MTSLCTFSPYHRAVARLAGGKAPGQCSPGHFCRRVPGQETFSILFHTRLSSNHFYSIGVSVLVVKRYRAGGIQEGLGQSPSNRAYATWEASDRLALRRMSNLPDNQTLRSMSAPQFPLPNPTTTLADKRNKPLFLGPRSMFQDHVQQAAGNSLSQITSPHRRTSQ